MKPNKSVWILGALGAAVLMLVVVVIVIVATRSSGIRTSDGPSRKPPTTQLTDSMFVLPVDQAEVHVREVLRTRYGMKYVGSVKCNGGVDVTIKKNDTFDCDITDSGRHKLVVVTLVDDNGRLDIGRPH
jgi:hypothetical protein